MLSLRTRFEAFQGRVGLSSLLQAVLISGVVVGLSLYLYSIGSYVEEGSVLWVYVFLLLVCAAAANWGTTILCGFLIFVCYDYFLVPPFLSLNCSAPVKLINPLALVGVSIFTGVVSERARRNDIARGVYQKSDQLRATLLNLISHNLRTPVATIKTAITSVFVLNTLDPESQDLLRHADRECDHLNRLIGNVLQLSKLDAHALKLAKEWNAPDELMSVVLRRWPDAMKSRQLCVRIDPALSLLLFDFDLLDMVLTNLIENAFRHGKPPIEVSIQRNDHEVWFRVADAGQGVPASARGALFTGVFNPKPQGIGLGLTVCRGIVEAHGGRIWAEFEPTRFTFALPLVGTLEDLNEPFADH